MSIGADVMWKGPGISGAYLGRRRQVYQGLGF